MKTIITLAVVMTGMLILSGCESITTDFDTNLTTTILAEIKVPAEKSSLKDVTTYPFTATKVLDIKENSRINEYIDRLKEINVKSITFTFSGIPAGETITELNISVQSVALDVTLEDLVNGVSVTLDVSPNILNSLSLELTDNQQITIIVSGESTFAPMVLNTLMDMPVTVTATVIK